MPDVSFADMAVGRTGADDGSTPAPGVGADEREVTVQDILEAIMAAEGSAQVPQRRRVGWHP